MMVYGYAKSYYYSGDSNLMIQVRVPSIHGPYRQQDASGKSIRNYTKDEDLPYYPSMILPKIPADGDVVLLASTNNSNSNPSFVVIGMMGSSYSSGNVII